MSRAYHLRKPRGLRHWLLWLLLALWAAWFCWPQSAIAALPRQSISIDLGNPAGELRFFPAQFQLQEGRRVSN